MSELPSSRKSILFGKDSARAVPAISLRLPIPVLEKLEVLAAQNRMSLGQYARKVVWDHVEPINLSQDSAVEAQPAHNRQVGSSILPPASLSEVIAEPAQLQEVAS